MSAETETRGWESDAPSRFPRRNYSVHLTDWCREFDVIEPLIPFEMRSFNPFEFIVEVREKFKEAPKTKATFLTHELTDDIGYPKVRARHATELLRLAGTWEYCETSRFPDDIKKQRWVNPEYIHLKNGTPSITDPDERIEELRRSTSLGYIQAEHIAPRFGIGDTAVRQFTTRWDIPFYDWIRWGRCRLSRTLKIIHEWTDATYPDMAEVFPKPAGTIRQWVQYEYAGDFEAPEDPSWEPWFLTPTHDNLGVRVPSCITDYRAQREVFEILQRLEGDWHYVSEISSQADDTTHSGVRKTVRTLCDKGLVESRSGRANWNEYRIVEEYQQDPSDLDVIELSPLERQENIDLRDRQLEAIEFLSDAGQPVRTDEIGATVGKRRSKLLRLAMEKLQKRGIVKTEKCPKNGQNIWRLADEFQNGGVEQ